MVRLAGAVFVLLALGPWASPATAASSAGDVERIREQAVAPNHPEVAVALNNVAILLQTTGDYAGARTLFERALRIKEQVWHAGHPDVALALANLAQVHHLSGDFFLVGENR
jgi:Tfp pilus assembly protein PilF